MAKKTTQKPARSSKTLTRIRGFFDRDIDFEGNKDPIGEGFLGFDAGDAFTTVGESGSGSKFAVWTPSPTDKIDTSPVVYLDSEGTPQAVVARSMDELLTLLPYGTGYIHDVLAGSVRSKARVVASPAALKKLGATPAKKPATVIAAAQKVAPDFDNWIASGGAAATAPPAKKAPVKKSTVLSEALISAIECDNLSKVKKLVDSGEDVNATDEHGMNALHYAALVSSKLDILKVIVAAGADRKAKTRKSHFMWAGPGKGSTPLDMAQKRRHPMPNLIAYLKGL